MPLVRKPARDWFLEIGDFAVNLQPIIFQPLLAATSQTQGGRLRKTIFLNLLVVMGGVLVGLGLLELGARLLPPPFEDTTNAAETCWPPTGWRGRPHFQTTVATADYVHDLTLNSAGMHDGEHPRQKPAGTYRILMLGDSFVQAVQVGETETAHQVLENELSQEAASGEVEVISGGVSGWGTGQQLQYYRHEGRAYRPDLVLLMLYMGNDVKDNLPGRGITADGINCYAPYFVLSRGQLDPEPWLFAPGLSPSLGESSWLHKRVNNALGWLHQRSQLYMQLEPLLAPSPVKASMLDFYVGNSPSFDYGLELTYALVEALRQEVERDGADFAVVLISPLSLVEFSQMDGGEREAIYQEIPAMRRAEEIDPPNLTLRRELEKRDIPVLDLLPPFLEHLKQTSQPLYFTGDKHWNVAGNRLAGTAIARWLAQQPSLFRTHPTTDTAGTRND